MRAMCASPGRAVCRGLGLDERKGVVGYAVVVGAAFWWSGVVHMGLVPLEPRGGEGRGVWELRARVGSFFWAQVVGMGVESVVGRWWRVGRGSSGRTGWVRKRVEEAGILVWVVGWLALTAWNTIGVAGRELGWWRVWGVPVSVLGMVTGERVVMWK